MFGQFRRPFSPLLCRGVLNSSRSALTASYTGPSVMHPSSATSSAGEPPREGRKNVITEICGTIMTIGINRPEARNAVNQETARLLLQAFESFEEDNSLTVAILHGLGGNFCAGYDLKELANNSASIKLEQDVTKGPGFLRFLIPWGRFHLAETEDLVVFTPLISTPTVIFIGSEDICNIAGIYKWQGPSRMKFSKPVIAAVSGYAVAGGLELSLLADLRVVEESAVFGVFCRRFGVPLIDGGTVRLPKLIGLSRALDLILTGRPVSAQEAYQFGLANRIVPNGQALRHAIELAEQISAFPQQCMRGDRSSAHYSAFDASSFTEAMQFEFDTGVQVLLKESVPGAKKFSLGHGRGGAKL